MAKGRTCHEDLFVVEMLQELLRHYVPPGNHADVQVRGLLRVSPGRHEEGALTAWSQQERLLRQMHRRPMDCYSLRIGAVRLLKIKHPLHSYIQVAQNNSQRRPVHGKRHDIS